MTLLHPNVPTNTEYQSLLNSKMLQIRDQKMFYQLSFYILLSDRFTLKVYQNVILFTDSKNIKNKRKKDFGVLKVSQGYLKYMKIVLY